MQKTVYLILLFFLMSCEKNIPFNINETNKKLIIEATINDKDNYGTVSITQTLGLMDDTVPSPVSSAKIALKDLTSKVTVQFNETKPGFYRSNNFTAAQGHDFELTVQVGSKSYIAVCELPLPILLDSIDFQDMSIFGGHGFHTLVNFQDSKGINNYYRFVQTVNGKPDNDLYAYSDQFFDGKYQNFELFKGSLSINDTVTVEMQCIDQHIYKYFSQLSNVDLNSGQQLLAPANPPSNFSGGALGYFSAYSSQTAKRIIR